MKNLRTMTMPNQPVNPAVLRDQMKHAGFKFDRETCPIKITKPWDMVDNCDGTVTWRQWEDSENENRS